MAHQIFNKISFVFDIRSTTKESIQLPQPIIKENLFLSDTFSESWLEELKMNIKVNFEENEAAENNFSVRATLRFGEEETVKQKESDNDNYSYDFGICKCNCS